MVKKKKHDKDKYYQLARQQGYRARSVFKLIQLNKKFDFLSNAKVCIDLCAAPGGWCQVAAKYMPASSIILGIDLLPIRPIPNVKTFQCDITTQKCRQIIKKELQTWQADVVLCDGAPNVGAEYSKDAYVQNELALVALKLAVDVLGPRGIFVTKVFRSQDYNALIWVFKQLFRRVNATKPLSSRHESAEIFVVCQDYLNPTSIDPKLLDPKYVFDQIDEGKNSGVNIFHKKFGEQKRFREGYDESLGQTLTNVKSVGDFVTCSDAVSMLTNATAIKFSDDDALYAQHEATTDEVRLCLADLKVLGKSEFKALLKWRVRMREYRKELLEEDSKHSKAKQTDDEIEEEELEMDPEERVQEEMREIQAREMSKKKREKKKLREALAKQRMRIRLGMDKVAVDLPGRDGTFDLSTMRATKEDLEALAEVDLSKTEVPAEGLSDEEKMPSQSDTEEQDSDNDVEIEENMDLLYSEYIKKRSGGLEKGTKAAKRSKKAKMEKANELSAQDATLYDGDVGEYTKLLTGKEKDSDDSDSDSDNSEVHPATDGEGLDGEDSDDTEKKNPLILKPREKQEKADVVAKRWFSKSSLFDEAEEEAKFATWKAEAAERKAVVPSDSDDDETELLEMPKTDKEIRKEKRKQALARKERRDKKRQKMLDEGFEVTGADEIKSNAAPSKLDESEPAKGAETLKAESKRRNAEKLIKAGMGLALSEGQAKGKDEGFEIVSKTPTLEVKDQRKYDSDNEGYDTDDNVKTLALATMMLRRSKAKEMVDASYNRFAWNDAADLPAWFVDDEEKHYRPQVPIPKEIKEKMKEKFLSLASKPIAKVAEVRARKKKRTVQKLKTAKKKATEIANLPDMTTREKLKAIDKAMKGSKVKKPSKVYVVSRRGKASVNNKSGGKVKGGKVKMVDARMKKDQRAMKRKEKKSGKSKRRK